MNQEQTGTGGITLPFFLALGGIVIASLLSAAVQPTRGDLKGPGFPAITEKGISAHLATLAHPGMEGRDTPSEGQARAARYLVGLYREYGLVPAADSLEVMGDHGEDGPEHDSKEGSFYRPFMREVNAPDPDNSLLSVSGKEEITFEYGKDFVPIHRASGGCRSEAITIPPSARKKGRVIPPVPVCS